jgi:hypothetical protein
MATPCVMSLLHLISMFSNPNIDKDNHGVLYVFGFTFVHTALGVVMVEVVLLALIGAREYFWFFFLSLFRL